MATSVPARPCSDHDVSTMGYIESSSFGDLTDTGLLKELVSSSRCHEGGNPGQDYRIPAPVLELAKVLSAPRTPQKPRCTLETEEPAGSGPPIALGMGVVPTSKETPAPAQTTGGFHGIPSEPSLSTVLGTLLTFKDNLKERVDSTQPPEHAAVKAGQAFDLRASRQPLPVLPVEGTRSAARTKDRVTSQGHTADRPNWASAPDEPKKDTWRNVGSKGSTNSGIAHPSRTNKRPRHRMRNKRAHSSTSGNPTQTRESPQGSPHGQDNAQQSYPPSNPSGLAEPLMLSARLRPPYRLPLTGHPSPGPTDVQYNYLPGPPASMVLTDPTISFGMEFTRPSGTLAPTCGPGNSNPTFAGVYGGPGRGDSASVKNTSDFASRPSEYNEATSPAIVNTWSRVPGQGWCEVPPLYSEARGKPIGTRSNLAVSLRSRWPPQDSPETLQGNSAPTPTDHSPSVYHPHPRDSGDLSHTFGLRGFGNPAPSLAQFSPYPPVEPPQIWDQKGQLQTPFRNDINGVGTSHQYTNHSVSGSVDAWERGCSRRFGRNLE